MGGGGDQKGLRAGGLRWGGGERSWETPSSCKRVGRFLWLLLSLIPGAALPPSGCRWNPVERGRALGPTCRVWGHEGLGDGRVWQATDPLLHPPSPQGHPGSPWFQTWQPPNPVPAVGGRGPQAPSPERRRHRPAPHPHPGGPRAPGQEARAAGLAEGPRKGECARQKDANKEERHEKQKTYKPQRGKKIPTMKPKTSYLKKSIKQMNSYLDRRGKMKGMTGVRNGRGKRRVTSRPAETRALSPPY